MARHLLQMGERKRVRNTSCLSIFAKDGYCWNHDFKVAKQHFSMTCNNLDEGHKKEMMHENTMGGSQFNKGYDS